MALQMLFFNVVYLITAAVSDKWLNLYHGASLQSDIIIERGSKSVIYICVPPHTKKELNRICLFSLLSPLL